MYNFELLLLKCNALSQHGKLRVKKSKVLFPPGWAIPRLDWSNPWSYLHKVPKFQNLESTLNQFYWFGSIPRLVHGAGWYFLHFILISISFFFVFFWKNKTYYFKVHIYQHLIFRTTILSNKMMRSKKSIKAKHNFKAIGNYPTYPLLNWNDSWHVLIFRAHAHPSMVD